MFQSVASETTMPGSFSTGDARPVSFGDCFGWLHCCAAQTPGEVAFVICAGLTGDKVTGHRPFRELANTLALNGYPTLRFDYPGGGDSCELGDEESLAAWQDSIGRAIDWLRIRSGAKRVVLVGLRIGATLAALVAEKRGDVAGLIMLEPILRGRGFVRQLSIERLARRGDDGVADDGLEAHELLLSNETVGRIGQVDLSKARLPVGCAVAIYSRSLSLAVKEVVEAWRALGVNVDHFGLDGLEPFLRPTFMSHDGPANMTGILNWLRHALPARPNPDASAPIFDYIPLTGEGWIETPLFFGPQGQLFGMLCRPLASPDADQAVIITNSSGDPHYGPGRVSVELARKLATEGIASLRMDFTGIGDSSGPVTANAATHIMDVDRTSDIGHALDALEENSFRRFAVLGVCTGAYHALQIALVDDRIDQLVLVNLPMFTWRAGDPVELILEQGRTYYLRTLCQPKFCLRLLRNELDLSRSLRFFRSRALKLLRGAWQRCADWPGSRRASAARTTMDNLSRRKVRTLLLYAAGDVTLNVLEREFDAAGAKLRDATVRILPGLDHSLTRRAMRQTVASNVVSFLSEDIGFRRPNGAVARPCSSAKHPRFFAASTTA